MDIVWAKLNFELCPRFLWFLLKVTLKCSWREATQMTCATISNSSEWIKSCLLHVKQYIIENHANYEGYMAPDGYNYKIMFCTNFMHLFNEKLLEMKTVHWSKLSRSTSFSGCQEINCKKLKSKKIKLWTKYLILAIVLLFKKIFILYCGVDSSILFCISSPEKFQLRFRPPDMHT